MTQPIKIENIPTRERADLRARILRAQFPDWTVTVVPQADGLFTVSAVPPAAAGGRAGGTGGGGSGGSAGGAAVATPESAARHPDATVAGARPLLELIGRAESGGNYDARWGAAGSTSPRFTAMTLDDVIAWQRDQATSGAISTAVGKYQIIQGTLRGLMSPKHLGLTGRELYDAALQDQMALTLLLGRGLEYFLAGAMQQPDFINEIAKEWAGLPNMTGRSHYDGDGVNAATVSLAEVQKAVGALRA